MNENGSQSPIIIPNKPKLVVPGQKQEKPRATQMPDIPFPILLNLFASAMEQICDRLGKDFEAFEGEAPNGTKIHLHFSRGDASDVFKKWAGKAEKRLVKPEASDE